MKRYNFMVHLSIVLLMLGLISCQAFAGQKSGLKGKVVDAKGKGIAGVKVMARLLSTATVVKGYDYFDATTKKDGSFHFKKLLPFSDYALALWHKKWETNVEMKIKTAPDGETVELDKPLVVQIALNKNGDIVNPHTSKARFVKNNEVVITDSKTGLQWFVGPDGDTDWNQASSWVRGLSVGGGGWRMPTMKELKDLYFKGMGNRNMPPVFNTTGWFVWSGETAGSSGAWGFYFDAGEELSFTRSHRSRYLRAFAVRARR